MSGTWREVEGDFVDTSGILPFEKPSGAYNLTVPNKLPVTTPDPVPMTVQRPVQRAWQEEARPLPQPRPRQRIRVIAKRTPAVQPNIGTIDDCWHYADPEECYGGSYAWSCLGFVGLIGSMVVAYHLLTRKHRHIVKSRNPTQKWVLDSHGTLHLAQVIPDEEQDEGSDVDARSDISG